MINIAKLFGPKTDFSDLLKKGAFVIDVRTREEFYAGHYPGSENIPLDDITQRVQEIRVKQKPVIVVCRSGARSSAAAEILRNAGLQVYNGGAWTSLPK
jgi:rhodanese-related sulfurtransferase